MRRWIILIVAVLTVSCVSSFPGSVPTSRPFAAATATPMCQHSPGVTVTTRRTSDTSVELHVSGLQPGENPYLLYSTSNGNETSLGEIHDPRKGADGNGEFTAILSDLKSLEGQPTTTWDVRVIHSHGVECTTITLP